MDIFGSIAKVVTDPGSLAQDLANTILPKELSGVVGNLAAGAVDYCTGNEVMAAKHGLSALTDLPQLAGALTKQTSGGTAGFEPSLPKNPTASGAWRGSPTMESSIASLLQQLRGLGLNVTININGTPGQTAASADTGWRNTPPHHHPHHQPKVPSSPKFDSSATVDASSQPGSAGKTTSADSAAKANSADSPEKPSSTASAAKTDGTDSGEKSNSADSSAKNKSTDSTAAMAALDKMSDTDFMNAIKSGNLDKSIKDDPAAMRAIQARMDAISQMNQLLTSMMQAMHQMQMAVIQNIRV